MSYLQLLKKSVFSKKISTLEPLEIIMLTRFKNHLLSVYPAIESKKLLLAVSGGIDSMVLLDLIHKLRLDLAVAHCNFNLRGQESDADQSFVEKYCKERNITFHTQLFDTAQYAEKYKTSIQIAARELRYNWFFELKNIYNYDYILTAHHLDDSVETFLINLTRGTGLEGLVGITDNKDIIRPLLIFSRQEIELYAQQFNLEWREDKTNASDKYLRNKIRHHIVPILKELNPNFLESFANTTEFLKQNLAFSDEMMQQILFNILNKEDDVIGLNISKLKKYKNYKFILYKWLASYGFTAWDDIYDLVDAQSGKFVESHSYRLLKNREELILHPKENYVENQEFWISELGAISYPLSLKLTEVSHIDSTLDSNAVYVDKKLLNFPLKLGKWKEGEYFYPLGMQGKKKKISKFFKDEKLSILDKQNTWILYSDNQVVWIIGKRLDERFKVTTNTTTILKIEYKL